MGTSTNSNRREFLKKSGLVGTMLATPSVAGCLEGLPGSGGGPVTLGVLSMLELDTGKGTVRGAEIAAEEITENGGVLGNDLQISSNDTQGTSTGAVEAYSFLNDSEGAVATLGTFAESAAAAVMSSMADAQQIHMNVGGVSPALSGQLVDDYEKFKYWFRLAPPNSMFFGVDIINFAQEFMVNRQGWESVALFREDAAWTEEVAPFLKQEFPKMGLEVMKDEVFPLSETNFSSYFSRIQNLDVDAIFGLVAEAGKGPVQGYVKAGIDTPLVGDVVFVQSPQYWEDLGGQGEGIVGRTHSTWSAQRNDRADSFIQTWHDKYDSRPTEPTWAGLGAYAATHMWANAVEAAGELTPENVVPEMENQSFDLIQKYQVFGRDEEDPITGQKFPHDLKYGMDADHYQSTWSEWVDGEQQTIWPPHLATAEY